VTGVAYRKKLSYNPAVRWQADVGANSRHPGTIRTKPYDMNAAFMLYQRHEGGIHVVSAGRERGGGQGTVVTRVFWERRSTKACGRGLGHVPPAYEQT
jgi:hypothetical protein